MCPNNRRLAKGGFKILVNFLGQGDSPLGHAVNLNSFLREKMSSTFEILMISLHYSRHLLDQLMPSNNLGQLVGELYELFNPF